MEKPSGRAQWVRGEMLRLLDCALPTLPGSLLERPGRRRLRPCGKGVWERTEHLGISGTGLEKETLREKQSEGRRFQPRHV